MKFSYPLHYISLALTLIFSEAALAQEPPLESIPPYVPTQHVSGTIRSWGHGYLKVMMKDWEEGFRKFQPDVQFQDDLVSSAAAMAGLYSGRADLGVLAREITPPEVAAYEKVTGQKLFPIDLLTGSYGNPDKIMTLGVFVNKDNPIDELTFDQLDAIFGAEKRRGERELIRNWGQLGLAGEWVGKAIQPYAGPVFEAPGAFFSKTVLGGSVLWNCSLLQLEDVAVPNAHDIDGYKRIVDAVGDDRYAIGMTGAGYTNPNVKLVALAVQIGGTYIPATKENVANRTYPLARPVRFYINDGPKIPADSKVIEFLRYILSRDGQQQVLREGEFFPLPAEVVARERARLK